MYEARRPLYTGCRASCAEPETNTRCLLPWIQHRQNRNGRPKAAELLRKNAAVFVSRIKFEHVLFEVAHIWDCELNR